jgi:8-oxo-dGTP pyrophosphatase MutT (NUDIX family)
MTWHPSDRFFVTAGDQPATGLPMIQTQPHACSYCGSTEFEAPVDNGRGVTATCSECGGTMSSHGGQWTPELVGDPSNHPSPKVDPRSGAGFGQNSLVHPEGFDMIPPKEAFSLFEVNAASSAPEFHFQHEERDTGGMKFPRQVDITAHHPDTGEVAGSARYFPPKRKGGPLSVDEVKGHVPGAASALLNEIENRHPGSSTKFLYEVKRNNNNPDITGHAHERAGKPSDWDTHYPGLASTIHRGLALSLPSRSARVVNSDSPREDHLTHLHDALAGSSLGPHWTEDEHSARLFAHNAVSDHRNQIPVVLHAKTPARKDIETREQHLYRGGIFPYGDPHSKENEVPFRKGRTVEVTGMSWKPDAPHPAADEDGWIHHTYADHEHRHHTAMAEENPAVVSVGFNYFMGRVGSDDTGGGTPSGKPPVDWDTVGSVYPHLYGDPDVHGEAAEGSDGWNIGDAANHLAHDRADDPGAEGSSVHDLEFHPYKAVPTHHIDYVRHPPSDPRVRHAIEGYRSNPDSVPPLVLVHRHGVYHVADGHHRAAAAANVGVHPRALVAFSPHPDEPFSDGGKGPFNGAEPTAHRTGLRRTADGSEQDYRIQHQAPDSDYGAPLHDVSPMMPDFYRHPHYFNFGEEDWHTSANVVRKAQGKPEHPVRIYRALPSEHASKGFNTGDWVTTSEHYAHQHGAGEKNWSVISTMVPAKHLFTEGNSLHEWAYNGPSQKTDRPHKVVEGSRHVAEADWCAHRHLGSCYWPGDHPVPGQIPQRRGACNWSTAWEQQACPMSDPGPMAGMFVKGSTNQQSVLMPVEHGGFAGFVDHEHGAHRSIDAMDRRTYARVRPNHKGYPDEVPEPVGSHRQLFDFTSSHSGNADLWAHQARVEDVDLSQPVLATQPYLVREHHQRYLQNPDDQTASMKVAPEMGDRPANKLPLFVRHEGNTYTIDGHHRTAAAITSGRSHIRGFVYDADQHGWPEGHGDDNYATPGMRRYSAQADGIDCVAEHASAEDAVVHAWRHHDDGVCAYTAVLASPRKTAANEPSRLVTVTHAGFKGIFERRKGDIEDMDAMDRRQRARQVEDGETHWANHYPPETPKAAGTHAELKDFIDHHQTNTKLWQKHGSVEDVDLSGGVYARQPYLVREHLQRYIDKPDDMVHQQRQAGGELNSFTNEYPGSHMPMFVRHQGNLFSTDGHHRVGAALMRGDKSIKGMVYDADKHGWQIPRHPDIPEEGFVKHSSMSRVPVARCDFPRDDSDAFVRHAFYHHDDGVCTHTGTEHRFTASLADPDLRFHFTATWADVRDKAKRIRREGGVRILMASSEGVVGEVRGEHAIYEATLTYVPGSSQIGTWNCGCRWAAYAWGRSPQYRRFEGRKCSHALALQYEAMSRSAHGREIGVDVERPDWLRQRTPVVIQHQRDKQLDLTRREVPPGNMRQVFSAWEMPADSCKLEFAAISVDGQLQYIAAPDPELHNTVQRALDKARDHDQELHQDDATYAENNEPLHKSDIPEEHHGGWRFHRNVEGAPPISNMFAELFGPQKEDQHLPPVSVTQYKHPANREPLHLDEHGNSWRRHYEWTRPGNFPEFKGWSGPHSAAETLSEHPTWSVSHGEDGQLRQHMRTHQERLKMTKTAPTDSHEDIVMRRNRNLTEKGWGVVSSARPIELLAAQLVEDGADGVAVMRALLDLGMPHAAAQGITKAALGLTAKEAPSHRLAASVCPECHGPVAPHAQSCPHCGAQLTPTDVPDIHLASKKDLPGVAGIVLKALDTGRILMLQRGLEDEKDPARGTWEFPGGHVEPGDLTAMHGAIREWEEEVGQQFPEGGVPVHTWVSPNGVYAGYVVLIPSEKDVSMKDGRVVPNPDDPKGDHHEQAAWWDIEHAKKNPALRPECKTGTPWREIERAGEGMEKAGATHNLGFKTPVSPGPGDSTELGWWPVTADRYTHEQDFLHKTLGPEYHPNDFGGHAQTPWGGVSRTHDSEVPTEESGLTPRWPHAEPAQSGWVEEFDPDDPAHHRDRDNQHMDTPGGLPIRSLNSHEVTADYSSAGPLKEMLQGIVTADPPDHSPSQNPASTGFATSEDPDDWAEPRSTREDLRVGSWQPQEGFSAWRDRLGEDLLQRGVPHPKHDRLYRAVSGGEMQAAREKGAFHPLEGQGLFVSDDPDRLAGGAYGGKGGGHIIEIDPSKVKVGEKPSYYNRHLIEKAVDHVPMHAVTRTWSWNDEAKDHLPSDAHKTALLHDEPEPALPSTDGDREAPLPSGTPMPQTDQETMRHGYDDLSEFREDHPELGISAGTGSDLNPVQGSASSVKSAGDSVADIVARFQATAGAKALQGGTPKEDQMDIASAARAHLAQAVGAGQQKTALKTFSPAEQNALIAEGADVTARNLPDLQIDGTHYSALEAALREQEESGVDATEIFVL